MAYTKSDLGPKMVNGVEVTRTDAEADALVAYWNANAKTELAVELEMLRKKRNGILSRTDWMANSDVTMTDAWKTYRQALRDITKHSNWPYLKMPAPDGSGENDWPVQPS